MKIVTIIYIMLLPFNAFAGQLCTEDYYNQSWCGANDGMAEVSVTSGIADCITATHAIETDWAYKWKEGLGQSLAYASDTTKTPGILIIKKKPSDYSDIAKLEKTIKYFDLSVDIFIVDSECSREVPAPKNKPTEPVTPSAVNDLLDEMNSADEEQSVSDNKSEESSDEQSSNNTAPSDNSEKLDGSEEQQSNSGASEQLDSDNETPVSDNGGGYSKHDKPSVSNSGNNSQQDESKEQKKQLHGFILP